MSFNIEGPTNGDGKLKGMKVYTATPILPVGGAAELLKNDDAYWAAVNREDELVFQRDSHFLKLLFTFKLKSINDQIKTAQAEVDAARKKLPF